MQQADGRVGRANIQLRPSDSAGDANAITTADTDALR
jgi:hypothetical protein